MQSLSSSNLVRYRPAVYILAGAAAAASVIYLHSAYQAQITTTPSSSLRRSNAVHRQRTRAAVTGADTRIESTASDDAVTELEVPDTSDPDIDAEGQRMHQLMFAISKNRARTEGIIHRGITCDSCHRMPITGIRYRCANCPDFDLCEDCEAGEMHIKTHVFYKVKVPAPWAGKVPQRSWYPGRPWDLPDALPPDLKKYLIQKFPNLQGQSARFEGMYQQFVCIANAPFAGDPWSLGVAIDRKAFNECFISHPSARLRNNLVYERMFALFDTNGDSLIDFVEYSTRLSWLSNKRADEMLQECFTAIDLNDDGRASRQDCLLFFRAFYELDRDITMDHFRMLEEGEPAEDIVEKKSAADFIQGGRCLSAYFDYYADDFESNPQQHQGKIHDVRGDLVPDRDPYVLLSAVSDDFGQDVETGAWAWVDLEEEFARDLNQMTTDHESATTGRGEWAGSARYLNRDPDNLEILMVEPTSEENPEPFHTLERGSHMWMFLKTWPRPTEPQSSLIYGRVDGARVESAVDRDTLLALHKEATQNALKRIGERRLDDARVNAALMTEARTRAESHKKHTTEPNGHARDHTDDHANPELFDSSLDDRLALGLTTDATDTIRDIIEQALNEMLDPVFKRMELWHLGMEASSQARQKYAHVIEHLERSGFVDGNNEKNIFKDIDYARKVILDYRAKHGLSGFTEVTLGDLRFNPYVPLEDIERAMSDDELHKPVWPDMTMPQNKPDSATELPTAPSTPVEVATATATPLTDKGETASQPATDEQRQLDTYVSMVQKLAQIKFIAEDDGYQDPFKGIDQRRFAKLVENADTTRHGALSKWMTSWIENLVLF